jgi:hypothetical protein
MQHILTMTPPAGPKSCGALEMKGAIGGNLPMRAPTQFGEKDI